MKKRKIGCGVTLLIMACICGFTTAGNPIHALMESSPEGASPDVLTAGSAENPADTGDEDLLVVEKGALRLMADKKTGRFVVEDDQNGRWASTPDENSMSDWKSAARTRASSIMNVTLIQLETRREITVQSDTAVRAGNAEVTAFDDGLDVTYTFEDSIKITLELRLKEDHLEVKIPFDRIVEGEEILLKSIQLLPNLGAGDINREGYLFVPDGCGALINFRQTSTMRQYQEPVYGEDAIYISEVNLYQKKRILMPVFGIHQGSHDLLGIIHQGAEAASIHVQTGTEDDPLCVAYASFAYRTADTQSISDSVSQNIYQMEKAEIGDAEVWFYPITDDVRSGYTAMADTYRQYLQRIIGINPSSEAQQALITVYGAVEKPFRFLGIPLGRQALPLTTFEAAAELAKDIQSTGQEKWLLRYKNWDSAGVYINAANQISPLKRLGGKDGLEELAKAVQDSGGTLLMEQAGVQTSGGGNGISLRRDVIRTLSGQMAKQFIYSPVSYRQSTLSDPFYLIRADRAAEQFSRFLSRGSLPSGVGLSFSQVGSITYSDLRDNDCLSRTQTAAIFDGILEKANEKGGILVSEAAMYSIERVDFIAEAPLQSSGYAMFTQDVPFYSMVLGGIRSMAADSIQESADPQRLFLDTLSFGYAPSFTLITQNENETANSNLSFLYGASYDMQKDTVQEMLRQAAECECIGKRLLAYETVTDGVTCSTFEGGYALWVNRTDTEYVLEDGRVVEAMGYCTTEMQA